MSIAVKPWDDYNRFNQTGYSGSTIYPQEEHYTNKRLFIEDFDKAEAREELHLEFLEELKDDHLQDKINEARDIESEYVLDDADERHNEGWL